MSKILDNVFVDFHRSWVNEKYRSLKEEEEFFYKDFPKDFIDFEIYHMYLKYTPLYDIKDIVEDINNIYIQGNIIAISTKKYKIFENEPWFEIPVKDGSVQDKEIKLGIIPPPDYALTGSCL